MDRITLTLDERQVDELIEFTRIGIDRTSPTNIRTWTPYAKADARMRGALLARVQLHLAVSEIKRRPLFKVNLRTEEASALVVEWLDDLRYQVGSMPLVAGIVGEIDRRFA